ncbi:HPr family phosphocarrier protein [Hydrogenoanaerobacterium sp.]|uniref:HPr family phosphocarrier protein n=1 Tax=Hydrogenoanaerobacterium sp. TaxID=2953763 RepID=UPI00289FDD48|nr:HPr family phosphocarrier protein [Hydrogenoanaerobacterium sp.]
MVKLIKLDTAEQLKEFMHLAWECPDDVGVHTVDDQIADAKSVLGLMSLDYTKPVKVVTESERFMKLLDKWIAKE